MLQTLGIIINPAKFGEKVTVELIQDMVIAPLIGAAGALALRAYEEKVRNPSVVLVFAAIVLYPIVYAFITLFRQGSALVPTQTILSIFVIITGVFFLAGCGMYYFHGRQDRR